MNPPFEGIFGDTPELRVVEAFMATSGLSFPLEEIGDLAGVFPDQAERVLAKLLQWDVLYEDGIPKDGKVLYSMHYAWATRLLNINTLIIEKMLGPEELDRIAKYIEEQTHAKED
jgi:hypothetical protein